MRIIKNKYAVSQTIPAALASAIIIIAVTMATFNMQQTDTDTENSKYFDVSAKSKEILSLLCQPGSDSSGNPTWQYDAESVSVVGLAPDNYEIEDQSGTSYETEWGSDDDTPASCATNNLPNAPSRPCSGDTCVSTYVNLNVGQSATFHSTAFDPDGDQIEIRFLFTDTMGFTSWLGPVDSADGASTTKTFYSSGVYYVYAFSRDYPCLAQNSTPSEPLEVRVSGGGGGDIVDDPVDPDPFGPDSASGGSTELGCIPGTTMPSGYPGEPCVCTSAGIWRCPDSESASTDQQQSSNPMDPANSGTNLGTGLNEGGVEGFDTGGTYDTGMLFLPTSRLLYGVTEVDVEGDPDPCEACPGCCDDGHCVSCNLACDCGYVEGSCGCVCAACEMPPGDHDPSTCGDGYCTGDETCETCPGDCGECPEEDINPDDSSSSDTTYVVGGETETSSSSIDKDYTNPNYESSTGYIVDLHKAYTLNSVSEEKFLSSFGLEKDEVYVKVLIKDSYDNNIVSYEAGIPSSSAKIRAQSTVDITIVDLPYNVELRGQLKVEVGTLGS